MYIFSYCPSLGPQIITSCYILPLLLGTLSHAEHHPSSPVSLDAALGSMASCSDRQLQLKVFGVLSFILFPILPIPHPQTYASCF